MGLAFAVIGVLALLLIAAVGAGAYFRGRLDASQALILDLKRRERRRERRLGLILAKLTEKAGLGPLIPRKAATEPETGRKPRPRVVPQSESVQRQIARDAQYAEDHPNQVPPKQVPVPADVRVPFLADVNAALNGNGRALNHEHRKGD